MITASQSHAFVSYNDPQEKIVIPEKNTTAAIEIPGPNKGLEQRLLGAVPANLEASCVNGGAHNSPTKKSSAKKMDYMGSDSLVAAANTLAPLGWKVQDKSGLSKLATWKVKGSWPSALAMAAKSVNGCAFIDWDAKVITLAKNKLTANEDTTAPMIIGSLPKLLQTNSVPTQSINSWALSPSKSLKENLSAWGNLAGWKVIWRVKDTDFRITHGATINGSFTEAMDQLIAAYEDGSVPISANMYEANHVIEIVDHTPFKRNTVE